jgi:hypothetical protein
MHQAALLIEPLRAWLDLGPNHIDMQHQGLITRTLTKCKKKLKDLRARARASTGAAPAGNIERGTAAAVAAAAAQGESRGTGDTNSGAAAEEKSLKSILLRCCRSHTPNTRSSASGG